MLIYRPGPTSRLTACQRHSGPAAGVVEDETEGWGGAGLTPNGTRQSTEAHRPWLAVVGFGSSEPVSIDG